jgi:hypothetical protein
MIELVIRIVDGEPFQHPITRQNFEQAWPDLDFNDLPPEFARFRRIQPPDLGVYQVLVGCDYQWNGDWVEDHWTVRDMTAQERLEKQNNERANWNSFPSWTFNEDTCSFDPPVPYPNDGNGYVWNEQQLAWEQVDT